MSSESESKSKKSTDLSIPEHRTFGLSQIDGTEKRVLFSWMIKDFSKISSSYIFSPSFDGGELSKVKWFLKLYPKERCYSDDKYYIAITLCLVEGQNLEENEEIKVNFEVTLQLSVDGMIVEFKREKSHTFSITNERLDCKKILEKPAEGSFENDVIKIECKINLRRITKFTRRIISSAGYQNGDEDHFEKLQSDLGKILQNNENNNNYSDFEIKVQDETFKVHKVILSARSEVFSTMLSIPMQETTNSSVKIEDFDKEIVENMLQFIYTGKTDIVENNVQELLKIAEKYDLQCLKSDCEKYIIAYLLNNENCVEFLELADTFSASKLKTKAINFIIKFKNEVSESDLFQNLVKSNGPLACEILKAEWRNEKMELKMKTTEVVCNCPKPNLSKNKKSCTVV